MSAWSGIHPSASLSRNVKEYCLVEHRSHSLCLQHYKSKSTCLSFGIWIANSVWKESSLGIWPRMMSLTYLAWLHMKDVEDVHEVVSRLQKAFCTVSSACTSWRLHPRCEEEWWLRYAVGRQHCNKSQLGSFPVYLQVLDWSAHAEEGEAALCWQ